MQLGLPVIIVPFVLLILRQLYIMSLPVTSLSSRTGVGGVFIRPTRSSEFVSLFTEKLLLSGLVVVTPAYVKVRVLLW